MSLTQVGLASVERPSSYSSHPAPDCSEPGWYAIWTRSRHEQLVCRELAAKGIRHFLPTITQVSKWKDRNKAIRWPLFPGYCFARFEAPDLIHVLKCQGVVTVLSNDSKPIAVPDAQIEALQRLVDSGLTYDPCTQFPVGSLVRVASGPLAGIVGRVERQSSQEHLVLAIDLLNSGARVQVAAWDLEPL
jgi:transcription antitermination factor NusG